MTRSIAHFPVDLLRYVEYRFDVRAIEVDRGLNLWIPSPAWYLIATWRMKKERYIRKAQNIPWDRLYKISSDDRED